MDYPEEISSFLNSYKIEAKDLTEKEIDLMNTINDTVTTIEKECDKYETLLKDRNLTNTYVYKRSKLSRRVVEYYGIVKKFLKFRIDKKPKNTEESYIKEIYKHIEKINSNNLELIELRERVDYLTNKNGQLEQLLKNSESMRKELEKKLIKGRIIKDKE